MCFQVAETVLCSIFFHVLLSDQLKAEHTTQVWYHFYGYFSASIACIYGHHPGLLVNMKVDGILAAKDRQSRVIHWICHLCKHKGLGPCAVIICVLFEMSSDRVCVLQVSEHKTNRDFGAAQIYLEKNEFQRLEDWPELPTARNPQNSLVFFHGWQRNGQKPGLMYAAGLVGDGLEKDQLHRHPDGTCEFS